VLTPKCSCCGEERDRVAALMCHDDVQVCPDCVGWLRSRLGVVDSTPILPVLDMEAAIAFYENAGFDVRRYEGGDYSFVSVDDQSVFDLDQVDKPLDKTTNRAACYLIVSDVDEWYERFTNLKLDVTLLENKPWEMREFRLSDPSGNSLRFGSPLPDDV
jgi:hypothetical protein